MWKFFDLLYNRRRRYSQNIFDNQFKSLIHFGGVKVSVLTSFDNMLLSFNWRTVDAEKYKI